MPGFFCWLLRAREGFKVPAPGPFKLPAATPRPRGIQGQGIDNR